MAVRRVVQYPARVLKGLAGPVGAIGTSEAALAADLVDSMYAAPGCVGLAAPQLGVPLRAFAMDVSVMRKPPPLISNSSPSRLTCWTRCCVRSYHCRLTAGSVTWPPCCAM